MSPSTDAPPSSVEERLFHYVEFWLAYYRNPPTTYADIAACGAEMIARERGLTAAQIAGALLVVQAEWPAECAQKHQEEADELHSRLHPATAHL